MKIFFLLKFQQKKLRYWYNFILFCVSSGKKRSGPVVEFGLVDSPCVAVSTGHAPHSRIRPLLPLLLERTRSSIPTSTGKIFLEWLPMITPLEFLLFSMHFVSFWNTHTLLFPTIQFLKCCWSFDRFIFTWEVHFSIPLLNSERWRDWRTPPKDSCSLRL